jgi:hypothetical protein
MAFEPSIPPRITLRTSSFWNALLDRDKVDDTAFEEFLEALLPADSLATGFTLGAFPTIERESIVACAERSGYTISPSDVTNMLDVLNAHGIPQSDLGTVFRRGRTTANSWRGRIRKKITALGGVGGRSDFESAILWTSAIASKKAEDAKLTLMVEQVYAAYEAEHKGESRCAECGTYVGKDGVWSIVITIQGNVGASTRAYRFDRRECYQRGKKTLAKQLGKNWKQYPMGGRVVLNTPEGPQQQTTLWEFAGHPFV